MAENSNYDEYEEKDVHDVAEEDMPGPPSPDVNAENGEEIIVHEPKSENETTTTDGDSSTPPPAPVVHKVLRPEDQMRLYVWAGDDLKGLGDDVHCQQIYMILSLKSEVNETAKFQVVTETVKKSPEFEKLSVGKLPVLVDPVSDRVISDVQTIIDYLEQVFREPCLIPKKKSLQQVGIDLYRRFTGYLKNTNPNKEEEMKMALNRELEKLNLKLEESQKKYLDGDYLTHPDLRLLPRLNHVVVAGKIFKGYEIPDDESKYGRLKRYLEDWKQEEVYQETKYSDKDIEFGWFKTRGLDRLYIKTKTGYRLK